MWSATQSMSATGSAASPWAITKQDVMKYSQVFNGVAANGRLGGKDARPILLQYGLPKSELKVVWDLSDVDRDGSLTLPEFAIAVHIISVRLKGFPLPQALPAELVSSIKIGGVDPNIIQQPMASTLWGGGLAQQPVMAGQAGFVEGGAQDLGGLAAPAPVPTPTPAAAADDDDEFGEFGEFESATFEAAPTGGGVDAFGAGALAAEWPDTFVAPAQQPPALSQPTSTGVDDLFGAAAPLAGSTDGMMLGGGLGTSMEQAQTPSTADRAARMLDMFQMGVHEESKPKPKMADLMAASPKHSQSMTTPASPPPMLMDGTMSAFSSSASRVYDVFTALVEEDLGLKVSEEASTAAGALGQGASGLPGPTKAVASEGWAGDGFGAGDEDFGDFADATTEGDEFGEFESTPVPASGAAAGDMWGGGTDPAGGLGGAFVDQGLGIIGGTGGIGGAGGIEAAASSSEDAFKKGETVVYTRRDGTKTEALIVSVDHSLHPPSYVIKVDGRERETERSRLQSPEEAVSGPQVPGVVNAGAGMLGMGMGIDATGSGGLGGGGVDVWGAGTGGGIAEGLEVSGAGGGWAGGSRGGAVGEEDEWGGFGGQESWGEDAGGWGNAGVGAGERFEDDDESVKQLMDMGFTRRRVLRALEECNFDVEKATDWLLERIGAGEDAALQPAVEGLQGHGVGVGLAAAQPVGGVGLTGATTLPPASGSTLGDPFAGLMGAADPAAAVPGDGGSLQGLGAMGVAGGGGGGAVDNEDWGEWGGDAGAEGKDAAAEVGGMAGAVGVGMGLSMAGTAGVPTPAGALHRLESEDDDFGDFEEYKEGEGSALPDIDTLNAMTAESLQIAGHMASAGAGDEWGGWGQDAGPMPEGTAAESIAVVQVAPALVGLGEDPFADLIGSGVADDGGGEEEAAQGDEEGPGLILGNVDISAVVTGGGLAGPIPVPMAGEAEEDAQREPVQGEDVSGVVQAAREGGEVAGEKDDEFGEVDWGAAQPAAAVAEAGAAGGDDGGGWGDEEAWGDSGGWGGDAVGDVAGGGSVGVRGSGAEPRGLGGGGAEVPVAGGGGEWGLDAGDGWGLADVGAGEGDSSVTAGASLGGEAAASLLGEVDLVGGMSGWSTGPGESLIGGALNATDGGRKLSLDLMDMTAEPAAVAGVPVGLSLGWGLGLDGGEDAEEEEGGEAAVLACSGRQLRKGRAVLAALEQAVDAGECGEGRRLGGLLERAEMREYVRELGSCYRVGARVGLALQAEGRQRRAVAEFVGLGAEVEGLVGRVGAAAGWASAWSAHAEAGIGRLADKAGEGCGVCGVEVESVGEGEGVVEWGPARCHSACVNLCLHCAPAEVLPSLSLPARPDAAAEQIEVAS